MTWRRPDERQEIAEGHYDYVTEETPEESAFAQSEMEEETE